MRHPVRAVACACGVCCVTVTPQSGGWTLAHSIRSGFAGRPGRLSVPPGPGQPTSAECALATVVSEGRPVADTAARPRPRACFAHCQPGWRPCPIICRPRGPQELQGRTPPLGRCAHPFLTTGLKRVPRPAPSQRGGLVARPRGEPCGRVWIDVEDSVPLLSGF